MESLADVESIHGMSKSNVEGGMLNVLLCLLNGKIINKLYRKCFDNDKWMGGFGCGC